MVSPERKRSCSLLPSRSALASIATKAPPLPGLMCCTLAATQSLPLYSMTLPARMELTGTFMGLPQGRRNGIRPRTLEARRGRRRACIQGQGRLQPRSEARLEAKFGLLFPGQVGGDHGVGTLDVGLHLGVGQRLGIVDRDPLGARKIRGRAEAGRAGERLVVLGRRLEADAAD